MVTKNNLFQHFLTQDKIKAGLIRYSLLALSSVIAITSANFYFLYKKVASTQQEIIFEELEKKAQILSSVIDLEAYEKLLNSQEVDGDKQYINVLTPLRKAHFSVEGLRYVYTTYKKDGKVYFGLDTSLKIDSDKDGVMDHSDFNSEYSDAPAEISLAITTKKIAFTNTPYTDKYGTFISTFIPLLNTKGDVVGVLGVDMLYSKYQAIQESYKVLIFKIYSVSILFILLFAVTLWYFYNKLSYSKIQEVALRNEIKEQQNFFIQDSKMSEIGKMVAGITHEINNPLAIIKGLSELGVKRLNRDQLDVDLHTKNYRSIINSTDRIIEIIKNMKSIVSRPIGTSDSYYFSIHESLNNVMTAIRYKSSAENISIDIHVNNSILVHGNRSQLEQVFFNLISNSIDAIATSQSPWIKVYCEHDAINAYIHFVDSGSGMTEELYQKIEKGFYTSKSNGSGMGLMICKKIIEIHQGELSLKKDLTTHFVVKLPINENLSTKDDVA